MEFTAEEEVVLMLIGSVHGEEVAEAMIKERREIAVRIEALPELDKQVYYGLVAVNSELIRSGVDPKTLIGAAQLAVDVLKGTQRCMDLIDNKTVH